MRTPFGISIATISIFVSQDSGNSCITKYVSITRSQSKLVKVAWWQKDPGPKLEKAKFWPWCVLEVYPGWLLLGKDLHILASVFSLVHVHHLFTVCSLYILRFMQGDRRSSPSARCILFADTRNKISRTSSSSRAAFISPTLALLLVHGVWRSLRTPNLVPCNNRVSLSRLQFIQPYSSAWGSCWMHMWGSENSVNIYKNPNDIKIGFHF